MKKDQRPLQENICSYTLFLKSAMFKTQNYSHVLATTYVFVLELINKQKELRY